MQWPIWRVVVAERSMEPVLRPGDWLVVWRLSRRGVAGSSRLRPGRIVVARNPQQPEMLIVKRVAWAQADGWWLDSDNPLAGAVDSARFGAVGADLIEGVVLCRYWRQAEKTHRRHSA